MSITGVMKAFMMLGDLEKQSIEERVAYKEKIVFATMRNSIPDWQPPQDWDKITNEEKLERLEKIQENI